jgi:hypothetical protein
LVWLVLLRILIFLLDKNLLNSEKDIIIGIEINAAISRMAAERLEPSGSSHIGVIIAT